MVSRFEICCILSEECACETGCVDLSCFFSNYRPKKVWDISTALESSIIYSRSTFSPSRRPQESHRIDPANAQGHLDRALGTSVPHAASLHVGKHLPAVFV